MSSLNETSSTYVYSALVNDALYINKNSKSNEFPLFKQAFSKASSAASAKDSYGNSKNPFAESLLTSYEEIGQEFVPESRLYYSVLYDRNLTNLLEITTKIGEFDTSEIEESEEHWADYEKILFEEPPLRFHEFMLHNANKVGIAFALTSRNNNYVVVIYALTILEIPNKQISTLFQSIVKGTLLQKACDHIKTSLQNSLTESSNIPWDEIDFYVFNDVFDESEGGPRTGSSKISILDSSFRISEESMSVEEFGKKEILSLLNEHELVSEEQKKIEKDEEKRQKENARKKEQRKQKAKKESELRQKKREKELEEEQLKSQERYQELLDIAQQRAFHKMSLKIQEAGQKMIHRNLVNKLLEKSIELENEKTQNESTQTSIATINEIIEEESRQVASEVVEALNKQFLKLAVDSTVTALLNDVSMSEKKGSLAPRDLTKASNAKEVEVIVRGHVEVAKIRLQKIQELTFTMRHNFSDDVATHLFEEMSFPLFGMMFYKIYVLKGSGMHYDLSQKTQENYNNVEKQLKLSQKELTDYCGVRFSMAGVKL